ncbi:MAG: RNA polymerase sigma factor [Planctomycetes bacterium]|nr:RNA polymerase sigma factor [Planctomycetota bacterium]MCP4770033.1 RNA polymerase sigma factor [Planctomycetota bacterium]MCP4859873.1 RNA polymerase sigma factor [Planctomycetota bacterium]
MSFNELDLAEWAQQLQAYLMPRLGRRDLAAELAQEAVSRLLRVIDGGQAVEHPRGWLFRVARNLAVDEVRKRLPQSIGMEWHARAVDPDSLPAEEPLVPVANQEVPRSDLLRLMPSAMQSLPSRDRLYLKSYYHEGEDFACLAEREGTSVSTVKGRLYRARRRLREVLVQQVREEGSSWS